MEKIYVRPVPSLLDSITTRFGLNPIIMLEIVAPDDKPNMCIWVPSCEEVENNGKERTT